MRKCPQCRRNYTDESLNFCLEDGSPLIYPSADAGPVTDVLPMGPSEAPTRMHAERVPRGSSDRTKSGERARAPAFAYHSTRFAATAAIVVLAVLAVAGYFWFFRSATSKRIDSVAVMPFANESGTADAEYLSDGITDSLINGLSKIPGLNVKARATVFRYKGTTVEPAVIGNELSVNAVLNGRVIQHGDNLSIFLSLVDTATGDQIWGEGYDRKLSDIVALQKEIAQDVSQKLQVRLSRADVQRVTKNYTDDPEAYKLYLRGRHYLLKTSTSDVEASIKYFQQAIDRDPAYALAYVGLADAERAPVLERVPSEALSRSKAAVQKALNIDDSLSEAHAILGFIIFWYEWNWSAAETQFKRAIELDPRNAEAHIFYAHLLSNTGRHDEALAEARLARELDPLNVRTASLEGQFLIHAGRVDEGLARLSAAQELEPNNWMASLFAASGYLEKGLFEKAVAEAAKTVEINPHSRSFSFLSYALAKSGRKREAHDELNKIFAASSGRWISSYSIALAFNGLGENDRAVSYLERGLAERDPRMVFLKVEPKWNNLRSDTRFQKVMSGAGF